jgi:Na+/proline symporter
LLLAATNNLTLADNLAILIYLVGTIAIGVSIGRRLKTGSGFFLGGRALRDRFPFVGTMIAI